MQGASARARAKNNIDLNKNKEINAIFKKCATN